MNVKPIVMESTNENKNLIRPRSSANKFHSNNIHKLIKDMDFSNIKHPKIVIESKDKLFNFLKNEQKIKNILKLNESIKEKDINIDKLAKDIDDLRNKNDDLENKIMDLADELDEAEGDLEQSVDMAQPNVDEMTYEQLLELEEQIGSVANGLTEEEIKSLKHGKFIKNKYLEDKCIICQYNFLELESVVGLPCKHCFHFACLKPWIEKQHYCPLCKTNIRKE